MSTAKNNEQRTWKRTEIPAENPEEVRQRDLGYRNAGHMEDSPTGVFKGKRRTSEVGTFRHAHRENRLKYRGRYQEDA